MKKLLFFSTLLLIFLCIIIFFVYVNGYKITNNAIEPKNNIVELVELNKDIPITILENVDNSTSEYNGKWLGLCEKNSINSKNTNNPIKSFKNVVMKDPTLLQHFDNFIWDRAKIVKLDTQILANITHRSGSIIKISKKELVLKKDEELLTDGNRIIRTFCCNDVIVKGETKSNITKQPADTKKIDSVQTELVYDYGVQTQEEIKNIYYGVPIDKYNNVVYTSGINKVQTHTHDSTVPEPTTLILFSIGVGIIFTIKNKK